MNYTQRQRLSMDERNEECRKALQKGRDFRRNGTLLASIRSVQVHGDAEQVNTAEELLRRAEAKFGPVTSTSGGKK